MGLIHWLKTGIWTPDFPEVNPLTDEGNKRFRIQVKEDLVRNHRPWGWRILLRATNSDLHKHLQTSGWRTSGWSDNKKEAIRSAIKRIEEIELYERNAQQRWEDI